MEEAKFDQNWKQLGETLESAWSRIKEMLGLYQSREVCNAVYANPYSIYNNYIFSLCLAFFVLWLIVPNRSKSEVASILLAMPFVMFHNIFDFVASHLSSKELELQGWQNNLVAMVDGLEMVGNVLKSCIISIFSMVNTSELDFYLLFLRFLLFVGFLLLTVSFMFDRMPAKSSSMPYSAIANAIIVVLSTYCFYPSVLTVLCNLEAHYIILLLAGPLLPMLYLIVGMCRWVFSGAGSRRSNDHAYSLYPTY